jgi:hypothetical protein
MVMRVLPVLLTAIAVAGMATALVAGDACKPARYQILGSVLDPGGRPIVDASVRLLLDQVSAQKFVEEGPRARLMRTNRVGKYVALIDCDRARDISDAPNPCAAKPRHLTISVEAPDYRTKLVVFKLKELDVIKDAGGCLVQVPDVKLSNR